MYRAGYERGGNCLPRWADGSIRGYGCTAVLESITKRLKLADASVAEDGYQDVINGVERKPYPTAEGLRNIQRLMKIRIRVSGNFKLEDLIAHWILRRLDESGFIDNLAKTYPGK